MVKRIKIKTLTVGIAAIASLMIVACTVFPERMKGVPYWYAEHLLEHTGERRWTVVDPKQAEIIVERILSTHMANNIWPKVLEKARLDGILNVIVLESQQLVAVVWFAFPPDIDGHVAFEDYCYEKKNGEEVFSGYSMFRMDKPSRRETARKLCLMKNVPSWYAESLLEQTGEHKWRVVGSRETAVIEEKIKEEFKANGIWTEDMEKMEREGKLSVLALESKKLVTVVWFYFGDDPVKHVTFKEYCYEKGKDIVLFGGGGTVYLEDVPICREGFRRND